jgi:lipopolysaccharide biosynthesis glycosyltransferase
MSEASVHVNNRRRFAYAFYATNDDYGCSVLSNIRQLRKLNISQEIDIVVVYLKKLSPHIVFEINRTNVKTKLVDSLPYNKAKTYYRDVNTKFRVLQLYEYDRIVYVDADTIILKNMDHLFLLPPVDLAAPRAYWLQQPAFTSLLLVITPSPQLWERRIAKYLDPNKLANDEYDMDALNKEFIGDCLLLPNLYAPLSWIWEGNTTKYFPYDLNSLFKASYLIHYSGPVKPWEWTPSQIRMKCPNAHPVLYTIWDLWYSQNNNCSIVNQTKKSAFN